MGQDIREQKEQASYTEEKKERHSNRLISVPA